MRVAVLTEVGQVHLDVPAEVPVAEVAAELAARTGLGSPARLHHLTGEALDPDQGLSAQTDPGGLLVLRQAAAPAAVDDSWAWRWEPPVSGTLAGGFAVLLPGCVGALALLAATADGLLPRALTGLAMIAGGAVLAGWALVRGRRWVGWGRLYLAATLVGAGSGLAFHSWPVALAGALAVAGLAALSDVARWALVPLVVGVGALGAAGWSVRQAPLAVVAGVGVVASVAAALLVARHPAGLDRLRDSGRRRAAPPAETALLVADVRRRNALLLAAAGVVATGSATALAMAVPWGVLGVTPAVLTWWLLGRGSSRLVGSVARSVAVLLATGAVVAALAWWPQTRAWLGVVLVVGACAGAVRYRLPSEEPASGGAALSALSAVDRPVGRSTLGSAAPSVVAEWLAGVSSFAVAPATAAVVLHGLVAQGQPVFGGLLSGWSPPW